MAQLQPQQRQSLIDIAKRHRLASLAIFGSYARGEASPNSDVDLYVRFGRSIGLFEVLALQHEMEDALGLSVDLIAEEAMIPHDFMQQEMAQNLVVLYTDEPRYFNPPTALSTVGGNPISVTEPS